MVNFDRKSYAAQVLGSDGWNFVAPWCHQLMPKSVEKILVKWLKNNWSPWGSMEGCELAVVKQACIACSQGLFAKKPKLNCKTRSSIPTIWPYCQPRWITAWSRALLKQSVESALGADNAVVDLSKGIGWWFPKISPTSVIQLLQETTISQAVDGNLTTKIHHLESTKPVNGSGLFRCIDGVQNNPKPLQQLGWITLTCWKMLMLNCWS